MKKTWTCTWMATLLAWAPLSHAAGNTTSASMEVSFRIVESCAIQSDADTAHDTRVNCAHGSPYELVAQAAQPTASSSTTAQHADSADAQAQVLTVAF